MEVLRLQLAPSITVVSDGAAGNEIQALAVAASLSTEPARICRVAARWPWSQLAPQWAPVLAPRQWRPTLDLAPWPTLAIGAGRLGAAALLTLKRASAGATRTVQILDPRIDPARFDVVITPAHDQLRAPNVIVIDGALNAIDERWIAREQAVDSVLKAFPSPRTVVLIGGEHRAVDLNPDSFARLAQILGDWRQRLGGSVIVIGSRRTPGHWQRDLRQRFATAELLWFGADDGENPYRAAIAWGDRFIVSADSVNMQCEALATGRPVYSLCEGMPSGKLGRFQTLMRNSGRLRPLGADETEWTYAPLRELQRITPDLRARLAF